MKKIAILYSAYIPVIDAIKYRLSEHNLKFLNYMPSNKDEYDLIVDINLGDNDGAAVLKCHKSLLPAFSSDEPIKEAFLYGAKVSGVTFYYDNPFKIVAQYPIFISEVSHYDEIEEEANYLIQTLFPIIIEKCINGENIDLKVLTGRKCSGSCTSCDNLRGCTCNH